MRDMLGRNELIAVEQALNLMLHSSPLRTSDEIEISIEEAKKRGWFETAAGTGRNRRSAPFDFEIARKNAKINGATQAAMTKLDCLFPGCRSARKFDELSQAAKDFVEKVEKRTNVPVVLIGTGPEALDIVDRR